MIYRHVPSALRPVHYVSWLASRLDLLLVVVVVVSFLLFFFSFHPSPSSAAALVFHKSFPLIELSRTAEWPRRRRWSTFNFFFVLGVKYVDVISFRFVFFLAGGGQQEPRVEPPLVGAARRHRRRGRGRRVRLPRPGAARPPIGPRARRIRQRRPFLCFVFCLFVFSVFSSPSFAGDRVLVMVGRRRCSSETLFFLERCRSASNAAFVDAVVVVVVVVVVRLLPVSPRALTEVRFVVVVVVSTTRSK